MSVAKARLYPVVLAAIGLIASVAGAWRIG